MPRSFDRSGLRDQQRIGQILEPFRENPTRLAALIVGAPTAMALKGYDTLLKLGVPPENLHVHLGKTSTINPNPDKAGSQRFHRFHPMMHSKAFYLSMNDNRAVAIVGSHNITRFALHGDNCELAVLLDGDANEPALAQIRSHISACKAEAVQYDPTRKEAYGWWTSQAWAGYQYEAEREQLIDYEVKPTIIMLSCVIGSLAPSHREVAYFELPEALPITAVGTEVHLYLFDNEPTCSADALSHTPECTAWRCRTISTGIDARTAEGAADWAVDSPGRARLERTAHPFRPKPNPGQRQVFVRLEAMLESRYVYEFDSRDRWYPVFGDQKEEEFATWQRVIDIRQQPRSVKPEVALALYDVSPRSGNYILFSDRRQKLF